VEMQTKVALAYEQIARLNKDSRNWVNI
jgi:hypothetical protein